MQQLRNAKAETCKKRKMQRLGNAKGKNTKAKQTKHELSTDKCRHEQAQKGIRNAEGQKCKAKKS